MVLFGLNVPLPDVVHTPVVVAPPITPFRFASGLFAQVNRSAPAYTNGASVMVIVIVEATGLHPLVAVNVNVTVPANVSAADGVYVGFRLDADGVNVPEPEVVQVPVPVVLVPPTFTTALLAHTV